ncbi:MAG: PD-(D/E)XK nuclease family protein [Steroidobacteraceae bacterium]|jgi:probable DNA repair protein|nr:PD-(D/E)XK nuclease family protein [Steroidobacteraceae bacterium]
MTTDDPLLNHLDTGGSVVTATRRQARLLRRRHEAAQRRAGRRVWRSADVVPVDAWLERCWAEAAADGDAEQLLSSAEAAWPWRRQVRQEAHGGLLEERDLGGAARAAWVALRAHGGRLTDLGGGLLTRDQQAFRDWALAVEADLAGQGWLDPDLLPAALVERAARFAPRHRVLFAGFERPTPILRRLADAIGAAGGAAAFAPAPAAAARITRHAAEHAEDELEAALDWLALRLAESPDSILGVVMPDLATRRGGVARAFEAALQPALEWPGRLERDRLVDFAGGPPLASAQVVGDALACLEAAPLVELRHASRWLRSRYLGPHEELEARLGLESRLRRRGLFSLSCSALEAEARAAGCAALGTALAASEELGRGPARRRPSEWASAFGSLLQAWGWPARRPLASDEFQYAERFREALSRLAGLDRVVPPLAAGEARAELAGICAAPFQPERGDARVLVYDDFEAPGLTLDGLWVSGVTASAWPRSPSPDPFLPLALQRRLALPGATAEACRDEALATTAAWLCTAPEVVLSWPLRQDDARAEASRLVPSNLEAHARRPRAPGRTRLMAGHAVREGISDDRAPALEPSRARGGARILELQAQCPFRAFAELRLGARELDEPAPGVDRRVRGLALHAALERAWRELGDSAALLSLDEAGRAAIARRCVAAALERELPAQTPPRLARLEAEWQEAAVVALLAADAERDPFEVVAVEEALQTTFAGVPLRLRVDRIDRTSSGLVLIDYKTGAPRQAQWRGARPDAPQLPLYAVVTPGDVAAIAFVAVQNQGARYLALGEPDAEVPGLTPADRFRIAEDGEQGLAWPEIKARWAAWLERLLEQHRAGDAAVDPKQPQTCRLCHLGTLCRVDRRAVGEEPEASDDA